MPRGDGTGPTGIGPMTGRAAGFCAGFDMPGYMNPAPGRGFGIGFGRGRRFAGPGRGGGRGYRHWFYATGAPGWMRFGAYPAIQQTYDPETEKQMLKSQADALQAELDSIKKRLEELEAGAEAR
jgi:hypothetical protein